MDRIRQTRLVSLFSKRKTKVLETKQVGNMSGNVALFTFDPMSDVSSTCSDISTCYSNLTPTDCFLDVAAKGKLQDFQRLYNENTERIKITDSKGNTALHLAATNGHLNIVKYIINGGADINAQNYDGDTALHEAVRNEHTLIIDFMLRSKADSSILNELHMAPIHLAIDINSFKSLNFRRVVKGLPVCTCDSVNPFQALLVHKDVDVRLPGEGGATPLHYCAFKDRAECAKQLLEHGAKPCTKCNHGYYPIHAAARAAAANTMEVLIKYVEALGYTRAEVLSFEDKERNTPLHSAVHSGHPEAVRVCLNCGAPVHAQQEDKSTSLHFASAQGGLEIIKIMYELQESNFLSAMTTTDILQMTPLHRAALFNHVDVVEFLLDKGADINAQDAHNRTPLFVAASKRAWKTVNLLIKRGANMSMKDEKKRNFLHIIVNGGGNLNIFEKDVVTNVANLLNETDETGCTPLHYAIREGQLNDFDALITLGALLNPKNKLKQSPLHFAARYGRFNTCKRLLNSKDGPGIINETDGDGLSAMHHAAQNGHVKILTLLMQKGAYMTKDHNDNSPLHMAAINGYTRSMKSILNVYANLLDVPNKFGNTPLHIAAEAGQTTAVTLLIGSDAKFTKNENGRSFLDLMIDNNHTEVAIAVVNHDRWLDVLHNCSDAGCPMSRFIEHMPEVCTVVLDNCQSQSNSQKKNKKSVYVDYDFQFLQCQYRKTMNGEDVLPMYALNQMVKFGRVELLSHPVCKAYLAMKWQAYGVWLYSVNFIVYIVFLGMLTHLVTLPCSFEMATDNLNKTNSSQFSILNGCSKVDMSSELSKWVVLIFTGLNMTKEVFQMVQQRLKYITDLNNALEWVLYISSAFFVGPILSGYSDHLEVVPGAIAIFLAWFNCLLFLQRFDIFGIYVVMFLEILRTILQACCVFSLLIVAFGLSFFLLMRNETSNAFSTPSLSLLRTGIMMLELDYMTSFNDPYTDTDEKSLPFPAATIVLLVVFVLVMPILLMNMLIGLAVGDIEAVQKDATLKRLAMQVELHTDFERRLPKKLLDRVDKVNFRVNPNCSASYIKNLWSKMTWQNALVDQSDSTKEKDELSMELEKQKDKIRQLSTTVTKNHELLRLIVQKMEIKTEDDNLDEGDTTTTEGHQCKVKCRRRNTKWNSEILNSNFTQSVVVSKWKQVLTDKRDNSEC